MRLSEIGVPGDPFALDVRFLLCCLLRLPLFVTSLLELWLALHFLPLRDLPLFAATFILLGLLLLLPLEQLFAFLNVVELERLWALLDLTGVKVLLLLGLSSGESPLVLPPR